MKPSFKDLAELISALIWPSVALFLVLVFRWEAKAIFRAVVERATKVSGFGVEIELEQTKSRKSGSSNLQRPMRKRRLFETLKSLGQRLGSLTTG